MTLVNLVTRVGLILCERERSPGNVCERKTDLPRESEKGLTRTSRRSGVDYIKKESPSDVTEYKGKGHQEEIILQNPTQRGEKTFRILEVLPVSRKGLDETNKNRGVVDHV